MAAMLMEVAAEQALKRERVFRDRPNTFDLYDDTDMITSYRFSRRGVSYLIDLLKEDLKPRTKRSHAITAPQKVFAALDFYGNNQCLTKVGRQSGLSDSGIVRAVRDVTDALVRRKNEFIKFPSTMEEIQESQQGFYEMAGFPQVVGCIDCTHVQLQGANLGENEYVYINRKGKYSINTQLVCSHNYKITQVTSRWPGSTHDARILSNSRLSLEFEQRQHEGMLLGDSGYGLKAWLMTPVLQPTTAPERRYNQAHCYTRVCIEMVNAQLKSRLRCLTGQELSLEPESCCKVITACCILHNIAKMLKEPEVIRENVEQDIVEREEHDQPSGVAVRGRIINNFFS